MEADIVISSATPNLNQVNFPPAQSFSTPVSSAPVANSTKKSTLSSSAENSDSSFLTKYLGDYPYEAPSGFHWIPNGWKLEPIGNVSTSRTKSGGSPKNKSFEELYLDKIKGPVNRPKVKRMKLDLRGKVITQVDLLEELQSKKKEKEEREKRKIERANLRANKNANMTKKPIKPPIKKKKKQAARKKAVRMRTRKRLKMSLQSRKKM